LKDNLAHYLGQVRQGREIAIKERNRVIARIVPAVSATDSYGQELLELAAQGKVRLPEKPLTEEDVAEALKRKLPRLKVKGAEARKLMERIWAEERGEY
jgi:antitoxin (DNA-binding transcriptional repressor) of toxin-antitoxin stability system